MEEVSYKRGDLIGHYQVLERLATGGFCAIYLAHDLSDHPDAGASALKVCRWLRSTMSHQQRLEHNRRLRREFELLHKCNHRNVVRTLEVQQHDSLAYYAMEALEGPTFSAFMAQQRQPLPFLMDIYQQVTEGLAYLHRAGIVHRDLKPSNIVITSAGTEGAAERDEVLAEESEQAGYFLTSQPEAPLVSERGEDAPRFPFTPVLIDLGISDDLGGLPLPGPVRVMGTLEYLSPEYCRAWLAGLAKGYSAEPPEDVHTMGVLLFKVLTGQLPWRTRGPYNTEGQMRALLEEIAHAPRRDPRELNPDAPPALCELAALCLRKHGAKRPADGGELLWRVNAAMHLDASRHMENLRVMAPEYRGRVETTVESRAAEVVTAGTGASTGSPGSPRGGAHPGGGVLARRLLRKAQMLAVGAALGLVCVVGLLFASAYTTSKAWERQRDVAAREASLERRAEQLARLEDLYLNPSRSLVVGHASAAISVGPLEELTSVQAPTPWLVGGLKMDGAVPGQLMAQGAVCSWKGKRLHAAIFFGACWLEVANPYWGMDPPQKDKKCPGKLFDPPPQADSEEQSSCFKPYVPVEQPSPKAKKSTSMDTVNPDEAP